MPTSLNELILFMDEHGYSHEVQSDRSEPVIGTGFGTSHYRDADGDPGVFLVIQLLEKGEYLRVFAPKAYNLSQCENRLAILEALAGIQWRVKMGRFEYDAEDGEVRPSVELAIEDATLTSRQFHRLLGAIPAILDQWHNCIVRAMETGVVDFETPADTIPDRTSHSRTESISTEGDDAEDDDPPPAARSHTQGKAEAVRAISQNFRTQLSEVVDRVTKHVNDTNAKEILGPGLAQLLGRGAIKSIVTFALYADVLRMVRDMVMADGEISDDEVQAGLELMSLLSSGFAKVRKDYAPHATLSAETARAFLSQYEADTGLFGYANESTKWAGVAICRSIQSRCDDSRPLDVFGGALVAWAEAIARADEITPVERTILDALRDYVGQLTPTGRASEVARKADETLAAELLAYERVKLNGQSTATWLGERKQRFADWLTAADAGDPHAAILVGICHVRGVNATEDKTKAVQYFRAAADKGHPCGMYNLGVSYGYGNGVSENAHEAVRWFRAAADRGHADAYFALGNHHELGEGVPEDLAEAIRCYRMAAEKGHAEALMTLGECYLDGKGVAEDQSKAAECFLAAAKTGHAVAQFNVGVCYQNGTGVTQDLTEAIRWFRAAAEQGVDDARTALAQLKREPVGAEPANVDTDTIRTMLAAIDDGDADSVGELTDYLHDTVATSRNAWSVLLYYMAWNCTQPPNPETDRVGEQSVPLHIPEWSQFGFAHDASLADLVSEDPPEVWQRLKSFFESREVATSQYGNFEMGNWSPQRLTDTLTRIYGGSDTRMPIQVFFAAEADGSGIRIFTPLAIGGAVAAPIRGSRRWVLESLFRLAEDDSRESVLKQPITIGGLLGRKSAFGVNAPATLHPTPVAWNGETQWVAFGNAWRRLKHPLPQLNVGYRVSQDLKGSAFDECIEGAVDSLVTLVDWMASAALENEQVSQEVLPWQPALLLAASASDALEDACFPPELTPDFARAERGDEAAIASINEYLDSAEDVDSDDSDDNEPPPSPINALADPPGTITNSIGMKLVPIPAGEFLMGSPEGSPFGDPDEEFQHRVRITKPFLIGMHQVTQSQYEHVTGGNPSFFRGSDLPVEHLPWKDAKRFCELLSALPGERQTGRRYRLPTEAEWEYACRAGTTGEYHTGDHLTLDQARFSKKDRTSPKQTAPVGSYPPNAWGLCDMHGNVWEWTGDWFSADYYRESPVDDPQGAATGTHHTLRGGSASVEAHECRAATRGEAAAVDGPENETGNRYAFYGDFGMRVVCEVKPRSEPTGPHSLTQELERGIATTPRAPSPANRPEHTNTNAVDSAPPLPASESTRPLSSRVVRIFISSTFRDFAQERDLLVRRVFPELRRRCRERQVELVDVDLRWGITEEEAQQGRILPICLAEIDRARPFFIGLIGDRYGWVPTAEHFDGSLMHDQPWLGQHVGRKSVTELEILHGVLNHPEMAARALFYFRAPAWTALRGAQYESEGEGERLKLDALKDHVRASGMTLREDYPDPETLSDLVLADLWKALDAHFPATSIPDRVERDSLDHAAFAQSRSAVFIGRNEHLDQLNALVAHGQGTLVLTGEPGCGKSSLLAHWSNRLRADNPAVWVFEHYIGATSQSTTYAGLIRRLMEHIQRDFIAELDIPDDAEELVSALPAWLTTLSEKAEEKRTTCLLLIDGLDQIEDQHSARLLGWLPSQFPANIVVVMSTLAGPTLKTMRRRHWQIMTLPLLDFADRRSLICEYLGRHRKTLTSDRLDRIAAAPPAANPLHLKVLLDELRVFGSHEGLDDEIRRCLEAPTLASLFEKMLERLETDYETGRAGLVGDALRLLWAARDGFSEAELLLLLKRPDQAQLPHAIWSPLSLALEGSLVNRSGLLGIFHCFLRQAVHDRYLHDDRSKKQAHRLLADFFETQPHDQRVARELPWQLAKAGEYSRLNTYLRQPGTFVSLLTTAVDDLTLFMGLACAKEDKIVFMQDILAGIATAGPEAWATGVFFNLVPLERLCRALGVNDAWVAEFVEGTKPREYARKYKVITPSTRLLNMKDATDGMLAVKVDSIIPKDDLIDSLCFAVRNVESLLYDCHYDKATPSRPEAAISAIHIQARRLLDAAEKGFARRVHYETDFSDATVDSDAREYRNARRQHLLQIAELRALIEEKEGDFPQAHKLLDNGLHTAEGFWGDSHPELLPILKAIAVTSIVSGNSSAGLSAAHRGLNLRLSASGPAHPDIKWWLERCCIFAIQLRDLAFAEKLCTTLLREQETVLGPKHAEIAHTLSLRARIHFQAGDARREEQDYLHALSILDTITDTDEDLRTYVREQHAALVADR